MPETPAPAWVITQQSPASDIGPGGAYVTGIKVSFRTAGGVSGSVFIPDADYTAVNVRATVAAKAAVADEVQGLQG